MDNWTPSQCLNEFEVASTVYDVQCILTSVWLSDPIISQPICVVQSSLS